MMIILGVLADGWVDLFFFGYYVSVSVAKLRDGLGLNCLMRSSVFVFNFDWVRIISVFWLKGEG